MKTSNKSETRVRKPGVDGMTGADRAQVLHFGGRGVLLSDGQFRRILGVLLNSDNPDASQEQGGQQAS